MDKAIFCMWSEQDRAVRSSVPARELFAAGPTVDNAEVP